MRISDWSSDVCSSDLMDRLEDYLRPETRLIWIETPSNPMMKVTSIPRIVELARRRKIITVVDNTFATPVFQRPLELGVDLVMHSTTKYFGGHSDVLGGAIICRGNDDFRSEERTSELQSLMRISYAVFCLKKKNRNT